LKTGYQSEVNQRDGSLIDALIDELQKINRRTVPVIENQPQNRPGD